MVPLRNIIKLVDPRFRYPIEVRNRSWFNDGFYDYLRGQNVALVWNQLDTIQAPPIVTSDFVYLGLIGDRSIQEKDFGRVQKDRVDEMKVWAAELKKLPRSVVLGIVAWNNHYAGYGAGTAASFMQLLWLEPGLAKQPSLADFGLGRQEGHE